MMEPVGGQILAVLLDCMSDSLDFKTAKGHHDCALSSLLFYLSLPESRCAFQKIVINIFES